jgi:menaquinone-dependent protoporphyrinogen IX oxidase
MKLWFLATPGEGMSKKVLIAYGSRYGSTEEIARAMAKILEEEGLETQLLDLKHTKQKQWPALASFDGLLIGSGIKMFRWVGEATTFLKKLANELKVLKPKGFVIGVFVSCGSASTPEGHAEAKERYVGKVLRDLGIKAEIGIRHIRLGRLCKRQTSNDSSLFVASLRRYSSRFWWL